MKIEQWDIERPKDYPKNARKWSDQAVAKVALSIKTFGMVQPCVVDRKGVLIIGHLRRAACRSLGHTTIPVHVASKLTPAQVRQLRLMDNRSHQEATWDEDLLTAEMLDLKGLDLDLSLTGFSERELDAMLRTENPAEDDVPPVPVAPVSRLGDLWLLGEHRVLCSDSTNAGAVARLLLRPADIVITDPPYGIALDTDWSKVKGSLKAIGRQNGTQGRAYRPIHGDDRPFDASNVIGVNGVKEQFWFGGDYYSKTLPQPGAWLVWDKRKASQDEGFGSGFELIWCKQKHKRMLLRHEWFGFLSGGDREAVNRSHPTQKPSALYRDILERWGAEAKVLYDPYLGSGTAVIAAESIGRVCFGMEIDPAYCDVVVSRWMNLTGKQATLEGSNATFEQVKDGRRLEAQDAIKEEVLETLEKK